MPDPQRRLETVLSEAVGPGPRSRLDPALQLVAQAPLATLVVSLAGKVLFANRACEEAPGLPVARLVGTEFATLVQPAERARIASAMRSWSGAGGAARLRCEAAPGPDSAAAALSWVLSPLVGRHGAPSAWIAMAVDSSERLQRELLATATLHRSILEMAADPILVIAKDGVIISASKSAESMFGWSRAELDGKNVSILMTEPHRSQHDSYLARYLATGQSSVLGRMREFVVRRKDGALLTCELSAFRIDLPGAESPVFCGFFRDVSERKLVQAREAATLASLATIAEAASVLVHEIKNPITGLRHALRALADQLGASEQEIIGELVERMQRLERRMRRCLTFLRSPELHPERCDLGKLARDVVIDMQSQWQSKQVRVEVRAAKRCVAEVDPPLIHDVLANLVGNALEATGRGGRIDIQVRRVRNAAEIHVRDDGPGIPPSIRETLFQPFVTSKPQGTGLGLMICKRIVEAHGGRIEVKPGKARGAHFVVKLPVVSLHARLSDR